ncbi:unnamed protein product [Closterium sp. Naga37s-1]|nr:unnamed protein product [Closterium sp. Naga37s-1]
MCAIGVCVCVSRWLALMLACSCGFRLLSSLPFFPLPSPLLPLPFPLLPPPLSPASRPSLSHPSPSSAFDGHSALLVMFICNHCPFVVHIKSQLVALGSEYISKHGLAVVAISSNSVLTHPQVTSFRIPLSSCLYIPSALLRPSFESTQKSPLFRFLFLPVSTSPLLCCAPLRSLLQQDGPDKMAEEAKQFNFPFPYLYDETQEVAKAYHAACTPDFFLFKKDGRRPFELAYHGQLDDSRPNNGRPVTGKDLRAALDCVLSARPVPSAQRPR